ncbi:MAG TPA: adenylate/guanylate cyclase domain-containing protein [Dermatophilaceae bacterium]|nr:adenylate/guanylate cyclase domain-containing protein [Dermatophilaceae bacterium]
MERSGRHRVPPRREPAAAEREPGGTGSAPDLTAVLDAVEARLLGQRRTLRRRDISTAASVSLLSARRFWRALGFPVVADEEIRFTSADLLALRGVVSLVRKQELDEATALAMTRAVARTTDRLAVWQAHLMAELVATAKLGADAAEEDTAGVPDQAAALEAAMRLANLADELEPLVIYAWRRHLAAALGRMVADAPLDGENSGGTAERPGLVRTVGFADLVSFTRLVRQSSERRLAAIVQRFEALASDVVTAHGGQVVKTVGDEVMYLSQEPASAAEIGLDLVEAMAADDLLPDLRVGVATGNVISRLGDVFGTTVNRASRLTSIARPRAVLVDAATAAGLQGVAGLQVGAGRPRSLRGIGPVIPWTVSRVSRGRRGSGVGGWAARAIDGQRRADAEGGTDDR